MMAVRLRPGRISWAGKPFSVFCNPWKGGWYAAIDLDDGKTGAGTGPFLTQKEAEDRLLAFLDRIRSSPEKGWGECTST